MLEVPGNVIILLTNVRKVCVLVLHCLICFTLNLSTKLSYTCVGCMHGSACIHVFILQYCQ